jgi:PII-like signaling protein
MVDDRPWSLKRMLYKGPAKKVGIFLNEDTRHHLEPLWSAIFTFLRHKQVAGAIVSWPRIGFGSHLQVHSPASEGSLEHLPVVIEFIETPERVDELMPTLYDMVSDGLIEVQDVNIVKSVAVDNRAPETAHVHERVQGPARHMRIFLGEADQWHGEPLYDAIVKKLRMMDIAGATVHRGILGYGARGHEHKERFFHLSKDLPIMISVVDEEERIARAAEAIEPMMEDGLIVFSDVEMVRLIRKLPHHQEESSHAEPAKI